MTKPFFNARRLGHVNLFVDDLDASTIFYRDVCGLAVQFTETGLRAQFLGTGHTPHDLGMIETTKGKDRYGKDGHLQLPASVGQYPTLNHLAWEIETESELVQAIDRCIKKGIVIDRLADHQIAHSVYLSDPDGNPLEFYVDTIRDWRSVLSGEIDLITSVWDPHASPPAAEPKYDPDPKLDVVSQAPISPIRLSHVVLASENVERLVEFYSRVAGLDILAAGERATLLCTSADDDCFSLAIVPTSKDVPKGMRHFSFELSGATSIDDVATQLNESGIGSAQIWKDTRKSSLFLSDPDEWKIEFFSATPGTWPDVKEVSVRAI